MEDGRSWYQKPGSCRAWRCTAACRLRGRIVDMEYTLSRSSSHHSPFTASSPYLPTPPSPLLPVSHLSPSSIHHHSPLSVAHLLSRIHNISYHLSQGPHLPISRLPVLLHPEPPQDFPYPVSQLPILPVLSVAEVVGLLVRSRKLWCPLGTKFGCDSIGSRHKSGGPQLPALRHAKPKEGTPLLEYRTSKYIKLSTRGADTTTSQSIHLRLLLHIGR